jgi:hypothetical protein
MSKGSADGLVKKPQRYSVSQRATAVEFANSRQSDREVAIPTVGWWVQRADSQMRECEGAHGLWDGVAYFLKGVSVNP